MKLQYLLPHHFKKIGWALLVPAALLGLATLFWDWEPAFFDAHVPALFIDELFGTKRYMGWTENNIFNEILGVLIIIGGLMVAFS
ncbi:MAG: hypothetical protein HKP38_07305, partial [Croceitalea sp.]|nr:hypothetical protein [Croceitalea sp.]